MGNGLEYICIKEFDLQLKTETRETLSSLKHLDEKLRQLQSPRGKDFLYSIFAYCN